MNKPFLHSKNTISRNIAYLIYALIPLLLFGFYKNGIMLYQKGLINLIDMFKPIIIPILGLGFAIIIDLFTYFFEKKDSLKEIFFNSYLKLYGLLLAMIMPIEIPYYIAIFYLFFSLLLIKILKKININFIAFFQIILLIIMKIMPFSYQNVYESGTILNYNFFERLWGLNVGGIATTSILLMIIGYSILVSTKMYKKEIPLYFIVSYILTALIGALVVNNVNLFFEALLNNVVIFSVVFIAPLSHCSPYLRRGRIVYGVGLGVLTYILNLLIPSNFSIFILIFVFSCFNMIIGKVIIKSSQK